MNVLVRVFLIILLMPFYNHGMQKPSPILSAKDQKTLVTALNSYELSNYFPARSVEEIEAIIALAHLALNDQTTIKSLKTEVKNIRSDVKKNKEWVTQVLNDLIKKAQKKLNKLRSNQSKKNKNSEKNEEKLTPQKAGLYKFIKAYIDQDQHYLKTRANHSYQAILNAMDSIRSNPLELAQLKNHFALNRRQVRDIMNGVTQAAREGLKESENKENTVKEVMAAQEKNLLSQVISKEQAEHEEKIANRLYIGLDIKDYNSSGKPINWKESIDLISSKMNEVEFVPNDYFHITIAWYESDKPIAPEIISKVEHALENASQILKIVFPSGVLGVMLLDGAVLLGARKDSVAFRVAESNDLKKLQEILLKFLSFEKIEGFKFSTFQKETPIHVTLGKIRPSKNAYQYQNTAEVLNAPSGARAVNNEGFTINTFRLTYSSAGHAWQEKMSYKF